MTDRPSLPHGISVGGVIAIARRPDPARVAAIADGLLAGGVGAFELTLDEPESGALAVLEAAARHASGSGLLIGAGTVLSIAAAERAVAAGASFLVMPHTDPDLVAWAAVRGIPAIPGAMTPSETLAGWRAGAAAIKLFPASVVGPRAIRELHGPFPSIPFVPSGGITVETAGSFVAAGAVAIGIGSWLTGDGEPAGIAARAARIVEAVSASR